MVGDDDMRPRRRDRQRRVAIEPQIEPQRADGILPECLGRALLPPVVLVEPDDPPLAGQLLDQPDDPLAELACCPRRMRS